METCPKCGSSSIHVSKKGFGFVKAVAGSLLAGPLAGIAAGGLGSNKIRITCLSCGHMFKPGHGGVVPAEIHSNDTPIEDGKKVGVIDYTKRNIHDSINSSGDAFRHSGIKSLPPKNCQKVICTCGAMNEIHFRFCRACGDKIDISRMETFKNGQSFEYEKCPSCDSLTPKQSRKCKYCTNCGNEF